MDPRSPRLTRLAVHWNQSRRFAAALAAWRDQGVALDVLVVDNGSRPEELDALRAIAAGAPDVEVLEAGENLGFGPGANVGLRHWLAHRDTSWVAVAPHDALPQPGCVKTLFDVLDRRPLAGLACADVGDGHTPVVDPYFGGMSVPAADVDGWEPAGYPHGTLLMARRACLEEIGLFDERYFAYCEEADLGERARRAGWEVGIVHGAEVRNPYLSGGAAVVDYLMLRNTLLLVRDNFGTYNAAVRFGIALWQLGDGIVRPGRQWVYDPEARIRALADFATGRFGPPPDSLSP